MPELIEKEVIINYLKEQIEIVLTEIKQSQGISREVFEGMKVALRTTLQFVEKYQEKN